MIKWTDSQAIFRLTPSHFLSGLSAPMIGDLSMMPNPVTSFVAEQTFLFD